MNKASAANIAQQARRSTAASKRGRKLLKQQLACSHAETTTAHDDEFVHTLCAICGSWLSATDR